MFLDIENTLENISFGFDFVLPYLIFAFVFLVFLVSGIIAIAKSIKRRKTIKNGVKKVARFKSIYEGHTQTRTVNDRVVSVKQYYGIYYEVRNSSGQIVTIKSPDSYTLEQARVFEGIKYFDVYVLGDFATIPYLPSKAQIDKYTSLQNTKKCAYCGASVNVDEKKCSQCGSSVFEEIF